ncbi:DNA cytosine methyltransferase [Streptomyces albidus (ex Kaewkla and Franco 2022)]|uniref:DNA cytosine methyltransferase n=1 Tax=Streptomyces albidus (ex Kaewkla and Franco 2022) TaxID=722709 RepID=UPI0015EFB819|nr:DNA (cytosine-5-)-methyltransferase [Streptomyces albidus (ex Kaewkla and Franco 2022)]
MGASSHEPSEQLTSLEICAGAGGQAIGLEQAGFRHLALVEYDKYAAATLQKNMEREHGPDGPEVFGEDVLEFNHDRALKALGGESLKPGQLDLLAGGVPCPPFSKAGQQLGEDDERDLFPRMLQLVSSLKPKAVMIENVRGIMDAKFEMYRKSIVEHLVDEGYRFCGWRILEAHNFDVPQLRPRAVLIAIQDKYCVRAGLEDGKFPWPTEMGSTRNTVFDALKSSMEDRRKALTQRFPSLADRIDEAYARWHQRAQQNGAVAPTLVGGSRKHGGADLGPSRAKKQWESLGVNAHGVANEAAESTDPERDFLRAAGPMLTVGQAAKIQGFPEGWEFVGGKTARYRQVGNAFPPPVARAIGLVIASVLRPELKENLLDDLQTEYFAPQSEPEHFQTTLKFAAALSDSSVSPAPTDDRSDLVGADL